MYLVGQEENKKLIDEGKLDNANFIIIKGPKNHGKTYLTKYIADHYKMNYVLLDNKVDTIRSLVENSNNDNNCLYHFRDFEKSSPAAKAALLKIAEETPYGVKIVITTSAYNMLDTLISRAYNMNIQAYSKENLLEYINTLGLDENLLETLKIKYNLSLTPTFLLNYKSIEDFEDILSLVDEAIDILRINNNLESIGSLSAKFWNLDLDKVKLFLGIFNQAIIANDYLRYKDVLYYVTIISRNLYTLNRLTITNFKQFIHNMMMEMIE